MHHHHTDQSSASIYELGSIMSTTAKAPAVDTASTSLHGSLGSSLVSSDGSEFPVQEVLGRYARPADSCCQAHVLI